MLGWNILWSDISRPKVCLANWSSTYGLELTNLMNLSFGRKSKLKIHKLCVFIQGCLLAKEYMQTSEAFFLALFAQQSFSGQKGAWVLCTTKAKDESGCNISDWEIHLKNLVEKYSLTETESKMSDCNAICLCLCLCLCLCSAKRLGALLCKWQGWK